MAYVLSAAGSGNPTLKLYAYDLDEPTKVAPGDTGLAIAYLQDVTVNNAQDIFTWTQLDTAGKFSVPTTSTNSIDTTIVVDPESFFASAGAAGTSAATQGLLNLSKNKQRVYFEINLGIAGAGSTAGKIISGSGYVTGLSPTVSADSPVWTTPMTITVDGDFGIISSSTPPAQAT